jgi:lysozyme
MVEGIDVASCDGKINWDLVALNPEVKFVYMRASEGYIIPSTEEGSDYKWNRRDDPAFPKWMPEAKRVGLLRGAYHFWRPDVDAALQRDVFLSAIQKDMGELPPCVDWESMGGFIPMKAWDVAEKLRLFCDQVRKNTGKDPLIYTNPNHIKMCAPYLSWAASNNLWISNPGSVTPWIPGVWSTYKFFQYDWWKPMQGLEAKEVDRDRWNGTYDELKEFCGVPVNSNKWDQVTAQEKDELLHKLAVKDGLFLD